MQTLSLNSHSLNFELTIGLARKIKSRFGVDFANPAYDTSGLEKLNDPDVLSDVMWMLVQPHAENLEEEEFFNLLTGDVLAKCLDLIVEEITLFIRPDLRPAFQAIIQAAKEHDIARAERTVETFQSRKTKEILEKSLDRTQKEIEANLEKRMLGSSSTTAKRP